ncbi:hypothetical protein GHJ82_27460 [Sinorhizobium saheli]|nr:hypothetical protein [Sinorhizobium saheli]
MRSHAFVPPLYLFVVAAFVRRRVIPPDCEMLWGRFLPLPPRWRQDQAASRPNGAARNVSQGVIPAPRARSADTSVFPHAPPGATKERCPASAACFA